MNAYVDPDLCIGCTQCAGLCPAVFQMEGTLAVAQPGPIPPATMLAAFSLFYAKIPRWARFCGIMQNV